jgi:hypothetical protein
MQLRVLGACIFMAMLLLLPVSSNEQTSLCGKKAGQAFLAYIYLPKDSFENGFFFMCKRKRRVYFKKRVIFFLYFHVVTGVLTLGLWKAKFKLTFIVFNQLQDDD